MLGYLEYIRSNKGKTSGSRVVFESNEHGNILLHKPHPNNELKIYQIKQLIDVLEQEGLIGTIPFNIKDISEVLSFQKMMQFFMEKFWEFVH